MTSEQQIMKVYCLSRSNFLHTAEKNFLNSLDIDCELTAEQQKRLLFIYHTTINIPLDLFKKV